MKHVILSALLAFSAAGCDVVGPVAFDDLSHDPAALVGTWDLVARWSYWDGSRAEEDPREHGWAETWVFAPDGTVEITVEAGTVDERTRTTYAVVAEPGRAPVLALGDDGPRGVGGLLFGVDGDRLILQDRFVGDAPERVFQRRR